MKFLLVTFVLLTISIHFCQSQSRLTTCDRVKRHDYPCETRELTTKDGYILKMFRVPHSHHEFITKDSAKRPIVFLMHCLLGSSDIWAINGPQNGLLYMLADAGYDVWMGNNRGTYYTERHVSLSSADPKFWEFSLDEIGVIDLPAMFDYIFNVTGQTKLHFVGYSQGTTALFMALATQPELNDVILTTHLMAPVAYLCHMKSPGVRALAQFLGEPNTLAQSLGNLPIHELLEIARGLTPTLCRFRLFAQDCISVLNFLTGWDSPYLNRTLLPDMLQIIPGGGSNRQIFQYLQAFKTCRFRAFDFGREGNVRNYGKPNPPDYNLANIHPKEPIDVYYSENDFFVSLEDVKILQKQLGKRASWHCVKYPKFNHFDFTFGNNVKTVVNDCILDKIQKNEGRPYNGTLCENFNGKPFE